MAKGSGTSHHRLRGITGWGLIVTLPFFLLGLTYGLSGGSTGFSDWLTSPVGAISTLIFLTTAIWYCKLEFDEVILDYTDGGLRSFGLLANRVIGFVAWAIAVFVIIKMWLGA